MVEELPLREAIERLLLPTVIAFGKSLIEHPVRKRKKDLLKKYNLEEDTETELPKEKLEKLILDLPLESEYGTGADVPLNSMRILQWLCDETFDKEYCVYFDRNDDKASYLKYLAELADVDVRFANILSHATSIGAGDAYNLENYAGSQLLFHTLKIIYIERFFVTHSFPLAEEILKQAEETDIFIAVNLSGIYTFNDHRLSICKIIGYANIVFGNAREMEALAQILNVAYDNVSEIPFLLNKLTNITVSVSNLLKSNWIHYGRVFVMSQGESAPAIVVWGRSHSVQVQPVKPTAPVIDRTGAGDGLVAGFLAGVLARWNPLHCLEYGCEVASFIVTRHGITLPKHVPPNLLK